MSFFLWLDYLCAGGRSESGYVVPTELFSILDRVGVTTYDNQIVALEHLNALDQGRAEFLKEKLDSSRKGK